MLCPGPNSVSLTPETMPASKRRFTLSEAQCPRMSVNSKATRTGMLRLLPLRLMSTEPVAAPSLVAVKTPSESTLPTPPVTVNSTSEMSKATSRMRYSAAISRRTLSPFSSMSLRYLRAAPGVHDAYGVEAVYYVERAGAGGPAAGDGYLVRSPRSQARRTPRR